MNFLTTKHTLAASKEWEGIRLVAGCLLATGATATLASAAPSRPLAPSLPPRALTPKKSTAKPHTPLTPARKPAPRARPLPVPATRSKLGLQTKPRIPPARVVITGRTNPDSQSIGLADERLRANALAPVTTLEDAIALSLANNPQRREAQAAVNAATANIGAVGSQGKLQVGANATTEYGRNTQTSNGLATSAASSSGSGAGTTTGGDGSTGTTGGTSTTSPSHSFLRFDQVTIDGNLPITTGGRVRASTRQARYQAVAQIYQLAQVEQDLILSTTLGYLDVLRAQQLLRVTNANLSVSQERLRIARLRYGVGASARLDVLQAQTALADARSRRISAVNALGTSNASLNVLLGRSPETAIRLASITRLNLPNIAYQIKPASVLPPTQGNGSSNNGTGRTSTSGNATSPTSSSGAPLGNTTGTASNGTGNTNSGGNRATGNATGGTSQSTSSRGTVSTGSSPSAASGGSSPSAPSTTGNTATTGATNPTTSANPVPATGMTGGATGATGTANPAGATGTTNATGAANPANATTATGGSSASTGALSSGSVPANASTGLQALAGGTRQSLAVTQAQIGAAEAAIEVAKAGKRPQLGLSLSGLLRNPATFLGYFGASIGLGLAQNLFDSGRTREQVNVARAALEQLQARLAGQRLEVAGAIETSLLTLDSAQRRQASSDSGVRSASEALRVAQIGFRSGVRTTLDLADAQASLLSAQTDAVNSRFDVADAQATLAAAVGIYTTEAQQARERAIRAEQDAAAQAQHQIDIIQPKPKKKRKKFLGIF